MLVGENQETPMHFHWDKMEDIIVRGGGNLILELYGSAADDKVSDAPVVVSVDGVEQTVEAGGKVVLRPGQSIRLDQRLFHRFYGEPGHGKVLVGEVSQANDDETDNNFLGGAPRFPRITEDEAPVHLLCTEYRAYL
jgi:D-lyxose ketol-isomerase